MGLGETYDLVREALHGHGPGRDLARDQLLGRLRPMLVLWCSTRMSAQLKAQMEPEDMAQEVLTRVHRSIDTFHADRDPGGAGGAGSEGKAFYGWLFTLAENCIRDQVDRVGAVKRRVPPPLSFSQTSPSQAAYRREQVDRLMRALDGLEPEDREIIRLIKLQHQTPAQVAPLLGKSVNAVRIQLCRALKALAGLLGGLDGSSGAPGAPGETRHSASRSE